MTLEIDEMASISPDKFDTLLLQWRHSKYRNSRAAMGDGQTDSPDFDETLAAATIARAQIAHHVARIHSKIERPREQIAELELFKLDRTTGIKTISSPATPLANDNPAGSTTTALDIGNHRIRVTATALST